MNYEQLQYIEEKTDAMMNALIRLEKNGFVPTHGPAHEVVCDCNAGLDEVLTEVRDAIAASKA